MQNVEAGLLSDVLKTFKNLSNKFSSALQTIVNLGTKILDSTSDGTSQIISMKTPKGNTLQAKITPTSSSNKFDIEFLDKADKRIKLVKNVLDVDFDDEYASVVKEKFGEDINEGEAKSDNLPEDEAENDQEDRAPAEGNEAAAASKVLKVGLKRVMSSRTEDIVLTKVFANYDAMEAIDTINALVSDDAFVATLPNSEQCFDVVDDGCEISVNECSTFNTFDCYSHIISTLAAAYADMKALHWNVRGNNFYELHSLFDQYQYYISNDLDKFAEIAVRECGYAPNIGVCMSSLSFVDTTNGIDSITAAKMCKSILLTYINTLKLYYPNFSHEIQSAVDNMIDLYKTEVEYKLGQFLK